MGRTRDDFSAKTVETLAKRVAYRCSNPNCGRLTIGPNADNGEKATIIGIAAHITAAAAGGPRFDGNLSTDDRVSIGNGIWLCANCSILIDREPATYSVNLLREWKAATELQVRREFEAQPVPVAPAGVQRLPQPVIDAELTWTSSSKWNVGASEKNPHEPIFIMDVIYINRLEWQYSLLIVNNSQTRAYNVAIATSLPGLTLTNPPPRINSLAPLQSMELSLRYRKLHESTGTVASAMIDETFPKDLNKATVTISYFDEARNQFIKTIPITAGEDVTMLAI